MTVVHCEIRDCENNEDQICRAGAIRISLDECCQTYRTVENGGKSWDNLEGDRLTWDREYFDDEPVEDDLDD